LIPEAGRRNLIAVGDRAIAVLDLPLNDLAGSRIGFRRWMSDDTDLEFRKAIGRLIGNALLVLLLLIVALGFAFWIRLIFRGLESALEGLQALARGDTAVQIEYAGQRDEVGASAQALRVFRQSQITLQSSASRAERRRRHQARFIEAQLDRLSATLGPKGREAMQEEIRRAGNLSGAREDALDSLAVALRVMVDHITAQQEALQRALAEQDVALQARARMQALEQEISVVSKMQARLTPSAMPSAQHVAVRSHLFQGHEFGGDFLDFFWLDDSERRLAVFIGSVDGQGLPAALLAVSARALVRALTAEAATPGACLSRVSDLLVGESTAEMALNMTLAVLDVSANLMIVARAGMPPPIAVGRLGDARLLSVESAPPLALRHGTRVPDTTIDLPERTLLVLFSQGMTSFEENGLPLGAEGVRALVEQAPDLDVDPVTDFLSNRLEPSRHNFRGDASFIALRLLG
jgi:sigma-B regulation protein RsbU (phosphoserine phosphatase)